MGLLIVVLIFAALVMFVLANTAIVVPQQSAYIVERLGRYAGTLQAGFHILVPFIDVVRQRVSLKETAYDVPEQICITRDNVQVHVDGVLYLKVINPERSVYGVADYLFAISQLAQTTLRSEIGKGHQGAALRDQEHPAAPRRARRHGEADARRAREARGDPEETIERKPGEVLMAVGVLLALCAAAAAGAGLLLNRAFPELF